MVICCHEANILQVVDLEGRVTLKVSRLKDRTSLVTELERREQSCDGTVKNLKQKLEVCLQEEQRNYQSQGRKFDVLHLDQDIKPSAICVLRYQLLGCSCNVSREVYSVEVQSKGYFLCGTVKKICDYSPICEQVQGMCLSNNGYLVLAHKNGISKLKMSTKEIKNFKLLNGGQ